MCGVSLKDRKRSVEFQSSECTECGGCGEVWHIEVEQRSVDDWVSTCRNVEVAGARCKKRNMKTWKVCMDDGMDDMKVHGLHDTSEWPWAVFRDV